MSGRLTWVGKNDPLPQAQAALRDPPGLVAAGEDISPERLMEAYQKGIFPWYSPGEPVLWWSPDPRTVLLTHEFHLSHSLAKRLRQIARAQSTGDFSKAVVTVDLAFEAVLRNCATRGNAGPDPTQAWAQNAQMGQTWITPAVGEAYTQWHHAGRAHSIETWIDGELVGGLYGVCIGRMFFGESMFSRVPDASKLALAHLVAYLCAQGVKLIDCQMRTSHLISMGAHEISRQAFLSHLALAIKEPEVPWYPGWLTSDGRLEMTHKKSLPQPVQALLP
jgi:leucyl/phenylalanyl-tRNA---protein transferase